MSNARSKVKRLPLGLLLVYGIDRHDCPFIEFIHEDKAHSRPDIPIAIGRSLTITWGGWSATSLDFESLQRWNFGLGRLWVEMV